MPSQAAYNAAKFAVRGFSDAPRMELDVERRGLSCTTVHPGGVKTNIARNARMSPSIVHDPSEFDAFARTTPKRAARTILAAVRRNYRRVLVGPDARLVDLASRLPTGLHQ